MATDPRLVLRAKLDALADSALIKRYAKRMGRTPGSVSAAFESGRIDREVMTDVIVNAETRQP